MRATQNHTINRQYKRLNSALDSDSDVPLSNYAGITICGRKLQGQRSKKTAECSPSAASASSPAASGRRSIPRNLTAGTVYSPASIIPWSAVERQEVRILGQRSSSIREEALGAPQTDAPERSSGRSDTTARSLDTRSSNQGRENIERHRKRDRPELKRCEMRGGEVGGNPRLARRTRRTGDPSFSDHSEDSSEEPVVQSNPTRKNGRHSMRAKLGNYVRKCLSTDFPGEIRKLCGVL